jgi:hypothetical protein
MRGCQWTEHQSAHTISCVDHLRGNWIIHWIQPGEDGLIVCTNHTDRALQTVDLSSDVSTKFNYTDINYGKLIKDTGAHTDVRVQF